MDQSECEGKGYAKRYCFTSWDDEEPHYDEEHMQFLIYKREAAPTTLRQHWQAYVMCKKQLRWKKIAELLKLKKYHIESARGTIQQNIDYIEKPETAVGPVYYHGEIPERKEAVNPWITLRNLITEGKTFDDIRQEDNMFGMCVRYERQIRKMVLEHSIGRIERFMPDFKAWQSEAAALLETQNDRQALFILGRKGNEGKSYLAKGLRELKDALLICQMTSTDFAMLYDGQHYVIINVPRCEQLWCFELIENLKDGVISSGKYEGRNSIVASIKVMILTNNMPDLQRLSQDRYLVYEIINSEIHKIYP